VPQVAFTPLTEQCCSLLYLSVTIKYAIGLLRSFILASNRHRDDYRPRSSSAKVRYNQTLTLTIALTLTLSLIPTFATLATADLGYNGPWLHTAG